MPRFRYCAIALGVDLWHDQRDVRIAPELRGVVDHNTSCRRRDWRELCADITTRREERDRRLREIEFAKVLNGVTLPLELR